MWETRFTIPHSPSKEKTPAVSLIPIRVFFASLVAQFDPLTHWFSRDEFALIEDVASVLIGCIRLIHGFLLGTVGRRSRLRRHLFRFRYGGIVFW
ncbi:MAG: hypothetical protein KatS3mg111_1982 [Pirellulaceae bacterium]|nr:MAG: hypothetical protein KatS3mg111_1982 [Pirellulaceae bacterium]